MAFTKYASLEQAQVLDLKGSATRARHASLAHLAQFEDYRTQDGYLYARIRAISSRVNKNHDGWPSIELAGSPEIFERHHSAEGGFTVEANKDAKYGYSTFLGKPVFVDHHNSDPTRARGVIVDAKLHVEDHKTASQLDPYYADAPEEHVPPTWVELLLEVDAKSFPRLAKAIIEGSKDSKKGIDGFSMGCDVEKSVCSICKNSATAPDEFCNHVKMKGAIFDSFDRDGKKTSKRAYEDCYGIKFFEISAVFDPADETALLREVRSSVLKEADAEEYREECPECGHRTLDPASGQCSHCSYKVSAVEPDVPDPSQDPNYLRNLTNPAVTNAVTNLAGPVPDQIPDELMMSPEQREELIARHMTDANRAVSEMGHNHDDVLSALQRTLVKEGLPPDLADSVGAEWSNNNQNYMDRGQSDLTVPENMSYQNPQFQGQPDWYLSHMGRIAKWAANKWAVMNGNGVNPDRFEVITCPECQTQVPWAGYGSATRCPVCGYTDTGSGPEVSMPHRIPETEHPLGPHAGHRLADHPLPQSDMLKAPAEVDTLRNEKICEVCGSPMDNETCEVCGYTEPPESFDNPDLTKAEDVRDELEDSKDPEEGIEVETPAQEAGMQVEPRNEGTVAHVNGDMHDWSVTAGRVNPVEKPLIPSTGSASSEPSSQVVGDQLAPVTSSVRTAKDFIAAAGRNKETTMSNTRVAADPAPGAENQSGRTMDHDHTEVDVVGVGGVQDASNESASKADAQVDVEGVGGTGVEGVNADETQTLGEASRGSDDAGFSTKKNIEAIPTKTFPDKDQHDPVTRDPYPASEDGVKRSSGWIVEGYDDNAYPTPENGAGDDGGLGGGNAVRGVQPVDSVGVAQERVDLLQHVTSPDNNSGPTKTWSGTDGNGVLRQQDPTTTDVYRGDENINLKSGSAHLFQSFKLADLEIELGLTDPTRKYERAAQLEQQHPGKVAAILETLQRVKTAGLNRQHKTARRMPVLGRNAAAPEAQAQSPSTIEDSALFT